MQLIISISDLETPIENHRTPVVITRNNVSIVSYAAIRDHNLVIEVQPFASNFNMDLTQPQNIDSLLHVLLSYQYTCASKVQSATRLNEVINIVQKGLIADIESWSRFPSMSLQDASTKKIVYSDPAIRFIQLILRSLVTREAYIRFDKRGDITGKAESGSRTRLCRFHGFGLDHVKRQLEMSFEVNGQTKGLFLPWHNIKELDQFGVYFQHPRNPDFLLMDPFSCSRYVRPHRLTKYFQEQCKLEASTESDDSAPEEPDNTISNVGSEYSPYFLSLPLFPTKRLTDALNRTKCSRPASYKKRQPICCTKTNALARSYRVPVRPRRCCDNSYVN
jgi:hypothetical protein